MDFKWRGKSRVVAYLDLIILAYGFATVIYINVVDPMLKDPLTEQPVIINLDKFEKPVLTNIFIIGGAIASSYSWAAFSLLKATSDGRDPVQALKMARNWRNVTIFFLLLKAVYDIIIFGTFINAGIWIGIRGIFIFIVWKFMNELKRVVNHSD